MRRVSLQARLFWGTSAVSVVFILLSVFGASTLVDRLAEDEIVASLERARRGYDRWLELRDALLRARARSTSEIPFLKATLGIEGVDPETVAHLGEELGSVVDGDLLVLIDPTGRVLSDASGVLSPGRSLAARHAVAAAMRGEETVSIWTHGDALHHVAVAPVLGGRQVVGILALGDRIDDTWAREIADVSGSDVVLLAPEGPVACSRTWTAASFAAADLHARSRDDGPTPSAAGPIPIVDFDLGGRPHRGLAVDVSGGGHRAVLFRPVDGTRGALVAFRMAVIAAGALCLLLAVGVSSWLAGRIGQPIRRLHRAVTRFGGGELDHRVDVTSRDEVGELGAAFNLMASSLQDALVRARSAAIAKTQFLATMSHELRTPLNGVMGMVQLLRDTELSEEQTEYVDLLQTSGRSLLEVISDVLDIARIESGKLELDPRPFDLRTLLEEVRQVLAPLAHGKDVGLTLAWASAPLGPRVGDVARIRQIVVNLVGNAIKFTPAGQVTVGVVETPRSVSIAIADTGVGIPPERLTSIFEEFSQVDRSTTREFGGTGLGLAICRHLTDLMGGSIEVESEVGVGSTFTAVLPLPLDEGREPDADDVAA